MYGCTAIPIDSVQPGAISVLFLASFGVRIFESYFYVTLLVTSHFVQLFRGAIFS